MKLILIKNGHVRNVYHDIYDPVIYPEEQKIVFSTGKIENIGNDYMLVEDHIKCNVGQQVDQSFKDYDQSHNYIKVDFQEFKEELKEKVEEVKEEIKELFTDDEGDRDHDKGNM